MKKSIIVFLLCFFSFTMSATSIEEYYQYAISDDVSKLTDLFYDRTDFFGNKEIDSETEEKCIFISKKLYENIKYCSDILDSLHWENSFLIRAIENKWFNVNFIYEKGNTLLLSEVNTNWTYGDTYKVLSLLLDNGADVSIKNDAGKDAFNSIVHLNSANWKIADVLVNHAISLKGIGTDLLNASIADKDSNQLWRVMIEKGIDVNIKNRNGIPPVYVACDYGNFDAVKMLVEHGANVNAVTNDGNSALLICCVENRYEIAKYLLEHKANPNVFANNGMSPLFASCGNAELMRLLLNGGANVNSKNSSGKTAVMFTTSQWNFKYGMLDTLKILAEYKANFKVTDKDKENALFKFIRSMEGLFPDYSSEEDITKMLEIIDFLLAHGIKINAKNQDGKTIADWCFSKYLIPGLEERGCKF